MRLTLITAVILATVATAASAANAYDRTPITLSGMTPDYWGFTLTSGANNLIYRYPGIDSKVGVFCVGVIMKGHESNSSWLRGVNRWWDKLECGGRTDGGKLFALILDGKGKHSWIVYRLLGVNVNDLKG